jgi:hypothetical protein
MGGVPFFTVTIDHVPEYVGDLEVKEMMIQWGSGFGPAEALDDLRNWAKKTVMTE